MAEEDVGSLAESSTESTSSRDDVAAAFDAIEARDTPAPEPASTPAPEPPAAAEPAPAPAPDSAHEGRDALGRFTPKREATPVAPSQTPPPAPAPAPETPRHLTRPPASWSSQEAAHWDKTPLEVREAVARREHEVQRVMQEAATARNGLSTLQQVIAPYIPNIQAANGGDVVGAIKEFFSYDNRLRHGSQIEKAKAAVQLIRGYGVDIRALDDELAGDQHSPETAQQHAIQAALQRELGPLRQHLMQQEQARQQAEREQQVMLAQEVDQGLQNFASNAAHPHYHEVRRDMADLLEMSAMQGKRLTLQDAYERACWQNPSVRNILIAGQQSAGAQAQHQAAQRARAAAVGVRNAPRAGAPANAPAPENRSRADDIAAAFAAHAGEA